MKIYILAVGNKMPDWVAALVQNYLKRINGWEVKLLEISPAALAKNTSAFDAKKIEEHKITKALDSIKGNKFIVSLAIDGVNLASCELPTKLKLWHTYHNNICFIIGGAYGLSSKILASSDFKWSMSNLTLPHMFVRAIICEQLYRAYTILNNHPYHK